MSPAGHDRETGAATIPQLPSTPAGDDHERHEAEIDAALGAADRAATPAPGGATATRDLLAEVADRTPQAPRLEDRARAEGRFVRWLLIGFTMMMALLLLSLWWLDPISVTGRETRFSVVENGGVRQAKLDLMQELETAPDVLVLGSSRSMKLDPADIERITGGKTGFNGAVSGGTTQDMYLYARYAEELWSEDGGYPHLVLGVVHDVFRDTGTAAHDPRLKRFLPRAERERPPHEVARQLLQLKTVEAGARAVRRVVARDGWGALLEPTKGVGRHDAALATTGRQASNQRRNLSPRGMQLFDPAGDYSKPLSTRIETHMRGFVEKSYDADPDFTGMDERGLERLVATIRLANEHGDVPTLWVTPFHPEAIQYLPAKEYAERDARFRAAIRELQRDESLEFTFVDLADIETFDGDPAEYHDGFHMTAKNAAKVLAYLHEQGALVPERG